MNLYSRNDKSLESPILASYEDMTYKMLYGGDEEPEEPWAVYDPE